MEFPDLGKHCHYCKQLDFLPFECSECHEFHCLDHRLPQSHSCKAQSESSSSSAVFLPAVRTTRKDGQSVRCSIVKCANASIKSCPLCGFRFCAYHRDHSCASASHPATERGAAAAFLSSRVDVDGILAQLYGLTIKAPDTSRAKFHLAALILDENQRLTSTTLSTKPENTLSQALRMAVAPQKSLTNDFVVVNCRTGYRLDAERPVRFYGVGGLFLSGDAVMAIPKELAHSLLQEKQFLYQVWDIISVQFGVSRFLEQEAQLAIMGFQDSMVVRELLHKYSGKMELVINELLSTAA
eukprot:ANDGO_00269.mRNA.1 Zinc finger AN1 and C2H2 domain-containing stress-associated protein 13